MYRLTRLERDGCLNCCARVGEIAGLATQLARIGMVDCVRLAGGDGSSHNSIALGRLPA